MEVSNRTIGIICASVLVGVIAVRTQSQSGPPTLNGSGYVASNDVNSAPTPAVDNSWATQHTTYLPGNTESIHKPQVTSYSHPISGNVPDDQTAYTATPYDNTADDSSSDSDMMDENGNVADDSANYSAAANNDDPSAYDETPDVQARRDPGDITDQEMLTRLMGTMNAQQQQDFRAMWVTMSPSERQDLLDEMRGGN